MNNLKFKPSALVIGNIAPDDIRIRINESDLELSNKIKRRIDELWEAKEKEAKERNLNWFNGTSYRLLTWEYEAGILHLDLGVIDFKHRSGLIVMSRNNEIDSTQLIQGGCFVGSSVKTADGQYVMVKMTGKSALNTNNQDLLGGMAETDVPCTDGSYIYNVLYQELEEEANIEKTDIASCVLRMMYAGMHGHFGFYFDVTLNITAIELREKFKQNDDVDIDSLLFYSREEYLNVLNSHNPNKKLIAELLEGKEQ